MLCDKFDIAFLTDLDLVSFNALCSVNVYLKNQELLDRATAARMAEASQKDWKAFVKALQPPKTHSADDPIHGEQAFLQRMGKGI